MEFARDAAFELRGCGENAVVCFNVTCMKKTIVDIVLGYVYLYDVGRYM